MAASLDDEKAQWKPLLLPRINARGERSPEAYNAIINALGVTTSKRYRRQGPTTFCNIFVWDATRAMSVEIPHWFDGGDAAPPGAPGADEMTANKMRAWLNEHGGRHGWHRLDAQGCYAAANLGMPAIVQWSNPSGPGHVGMVVPGNRIAQAGLENFRDAQIWECFGPDKIPHLQWWANT